MISALQVGNELWQKKGRLWQENECGKKMAGKR
jgi:hypothetical protein